MVKFPGLGGVSGVGNTDIVLLYEALEFLSDLRLRTSVEDFMRKLLGAALMLLPEFDRGSVIMKDNDHYRYVAWIGFPDEISKIRIPPENALIPKDDEPLIIDEIFRYDEKFSTGEELEIYERIGTRKIKKTVAVGIRVNGEAVGGFFLDSTKDVQPAEEDLKVVQLFARIASIFITMKLYQEKERRYQKGIIRAMVKAMEARDPYTVGHSERVALYAVAIAKKMGMDMGTIDRIYWGSIVHDIGKLAIPEQILLKPTKLSREEFEVIKRHPVVGEEMIKEFPWLEDIRKIVRNHHERCDGKGYPDGLKCEEIPLEVRIVSIADSFDAMTSDRAYRKGMPLNVALKEVENQAGKQFDPQIVPVAIEVLPSEYERIYRPQTSS